SYRHAYARVRGRQPGRLVPGQLPGLRGRPEAASGRRGRSASPHQVQKADAIGPGRRSARLQPSGMSVTRHPVGILLFDDVEVLDFAGPFEVFSRTRLVAGAESRRTNDSAPFDVFTLARDHIITAVGGLKIIPRHSLADAPHIDILVVPGGFGTRGLLKDDATLAWIRQTAHRASQGASVCTGALPLAQVVAARRRRATNPLPT